MATFATDTNGIIAAISRNHVHHSRARDAINQRLDSGHTMEVAAHSLAGACSVLTRTPPPNRLSRADAMSLIEQGVLPIATVGPLNAEAYVSLIRRAARDGISGGQIYDGIITATARAAGADELLTFNERHFRRFEGDGLTIVVP